MDYRKLAEEFLRLQVNNPPPFTPPKEMVVGGKGIVAYLSFVKDDVLVGELVEKLQLSSGRVAIALNMLEEKGLVVREKEKEDKRKVKVRVTEKGKKLAEETKTMLLDQLTSVLKGLGEVDASEFLRLHRKIIEYNNRQS